VFAERVPIAGTNVSGDFAWVVLDQGQKATDTPRTICFAMYAVQNGIMKMNVQLYPLNPNDSRMVHLEVKAGDQWKKSNPMAGHDGGYSFRPKIFKEDGTYTIRLGNQDGKDRVLTGVKPGEGTIKVAP
jgi:hypothetical protein